MRRYRVLGMVVLLVAPLLAVGTGGARATVGFDCNTSLGWSRSGAELTWNATESCADPLNPALPVPIGYIEFSSAMAGPSGAIENAGTHTSCGNCASDSTVGAVWALPGSTHTLIVDESAVAPAGEVWGAVDAACSGSGSTTIFCHWQLPVQELPGIGPATSGIDAGQQLIDATPAQGVAPQPQ